MGLPSNTTMKTLAIGTINLVQLICCISLAISAANTTGFWSGVNLILGIVGIVGTALVAGLTVANFLKHLQGVID